MARPSFHTLKHSRSRILVLTLCAIFAGIGAALFQTVAAERAAREQLSNTAAILSQLRNVLRMGLDAETGQRGFLLTYDLGYLQPYDRANREWLPAIQKLRLALGDDLTVTQLAAIDQIQSAATAKLEELTQTVSLARQDRRDDALALVETDEGKRLMDQFRSSVDALEEEEQAILSNELQRVASVEARTLPILLGLTLAVIALVVAGLRFERRMQVAEIKADEAEELRQARERSDLLARELNHRVKNLFAVVLSIVSLTARNEKDAKELSRKIKARIHALSLAHSVGQGQLDFHVAELGEILQATLEPYQSSANEISRIRLQGPRVELPAKAVTPIGLVIHELATNAVKYGSLADTNGHVDIDWDVTNEPNGSEQAKLTWRERNAKVISKPRQNGFGSTMIRQAANQLGGAIDRRWKKDGLEVELVFPVRSKGDEKVLIKSKQLHSDSSSVQ
ncbi:sensor histidine kinase [Notoacmeibacter sp. MSK16QG-6]|uniref:sensor histidine kinase n=1 Tax=Notoacmeibacter sp. MSK16QG-6 TaxID=2957982 RepID=UPI0020A0E3DB|nr:CHASE3 domain-containing protein [Notoacmeibacter sp. MSK16QG-6]MCP1199353.1 CHASE3 domain-containing protein [Notoacmeibacter sp. MSK16QG-6]